MPKKGPCQRMLYWICAWIVFARYLGLGQQDIAFPESLWIGSTRSSGFPLTGAHGRGFLCSIVTCFAHGTWRARPTGAYCLQSKFHGSIPGQGLSRLIPVSSALSLLGRKQHFDDSKRSASAIASSLNRFSFHARLLFYMRRLPPGASAHRSSIGVIDAACSPRFSSNFGRITHQPRFC